MCASAVPCNATFDALSWRKARGGNYGALFTASAASIPRVTREGRDRVESRVNACVRWCRFSSSDLLSRDGCCLSLWPGYSQRPLTVNRTV